MHLFRGPWAWAIVGVAALLLLIALGGENSTSAQAQAEPVPVVGKGRSISMLGGDISRNQVNTVETGILDDFCVRNEPKKNEKIKNIKWETALGTMSFLPPAIAGGRIFIATNNDRPRDKNNRGDKGVLMCFRESDGKFLWQNVHETPEEEANYSRNHGLITTPTVEGDRLYYVTTMAEIVCASVNDGKFQWKYDMVKEHDVFIGQHVYSSTLVMGDLVYAITCNGVSTATGKLPKPKAPSLVAVNKKTGKFAWANALPGAKVMRGQWTNPTGAVVNGKSQVIYGGGDGFLYGLDAKDGELIWKFDCNPRSAPPFKPHGHRAFFVATPVVVDGRCYIATGQEPDDSINVPGHLWCVDITKKPTSKDKDFSAVSRQVKAKVDDEDKTFDLFDPATKENKDSGMVWHYGGYVYPPPKNDNDRDLVFGQTLGTVAVHGGLVYASDAAGFLHCLDVKTGKRQWVYDFEESTWCSPYYVDGKIYIGTESGTLWIFQAGPKLAPPKKVRFFQPMKVPPVAVNGVLYINGSEKLYAIAPKQ